MSSCCNKKQSGFEFDPILHGSLLVIALTASFQLLGITRPQLTTFNSTVLELIGQMWWGVAIGFVFVGLMSQIPRNYFSALLGRGDSFGGILRAAAGGLMFDLCSHGILMVGAKLYERGASYAQVLTFLIASPWNSISMTLILITLIGWQWTLVFIGLSAAIAIVTGMIAIALTRSGTLPPNPYTVETIENFDIKTQAMEDLKTVTWDTALLAKILKGSMHEGRILLRWIFLGIVMASAIRAFMPAEHFADWFGPTLAGLGLTLIATTIIEVCSEGSSPIAADLLGRASAPGNAFTFLMAGVSTDYTEMMVLKDTTGLWKMALALPLITVPQILLISVLLNFL